MIVAASRNYQDVVGFLWGKEEVRSNLDAAVQALVSAVIRRRPEIMEVLLDPPSPLIGDVERLSYALHFAVYHPECKAVELLLEAGASLTYRSYNRFEALGAGGDGRTALHICCRGIRDSKRVVVLRRLLAAPQALSMLDANDNLGNAALHYAAAHRHFECCAELLHAGSKAVNALNHQGQSPYHLALGNSPIQVLLLNAGAVTE